LKGLGLLRVRSAHFVSARDFTAGKVAGWWLAYYASATLPPRAAWDVGVNMSNYYLY
jgi:hypothetical protein